MIAELENRLAAVLGDRLGAPLTGRVQVAPGSPGDGQGRVLLGVAASKPSKSEMGADWRPEQVPGADDPRRVLRLRCTVHLDVEPGADDGRVEQQAAVDALLYLLDPPDVRDGSALTGPGDPGFMLQSLGLDGAHVPLVPSAEAPVRITMAAEGWFWPVGQEGAAGPSIADVRIRGGHVPIVVGVDGPLVAGGAAVAIRVEARRAPHVRLTGAGPQPPPPFGSLSVSLRDLGGGPGAGSLAGGVDGTEGNRLVALVDGVAEVEYAPPDQPAIDVLHVGLEAADGGQGVLLHRERVIVGGP